MALSGFTVIGLEVDGKAIISAQENAHKNRCAKKALFKRKDLNKYKFNDLKNEKIDIVVLDPPRTGAKAICKNIQHLKPKGIIYVSCDPMTLKRDLKELINRGFKPILSRPIDMFPQTYHIESITILEKV